MRRSMLAIIPSLLLLALAGCAKQEVGTPAAPARPGPTKSGAAAESVASAGGTLTVFAGSASMPALRELGPAYEKRAGVKVEVTSGGSGSVLTQFSQDHFGDLYIPGSDDFMDKAEKKDAVLKDTRSILVYLVPVICVPKGNPKGVRSLEDLSRENMRVVIGDVDAVCLGAIAKDVLTEAGLWEKVQPRIATYASSCEDTLSRLVMGEADVVIGWDVFAKQNPDKVEAVPLTQQSARARNIPAAVIKWSKQPEKAKDLIEFLRSPEAKEIWTKYGYTIDNPEVSGKS